MVLSKASSYERLSAGRTSHIFGRSIHTQLQCTTDKIRKMHIHNPNACTKILEMQEEPHILNKNQPQPLFIIVGSTMSLATTCSERIPPDFLCLFIDEQISSAIITYLK